MEDTGGVMVKILLLASLIVGLLMLRTPTLKSLPSMPVVDIGQLKDPVP